MAKDMPEKENKGVENTDALADNESVGVDVENTSAPESDAVNADIKTEPVFEEPVIKDFVIEDIDIEEMLNKKKDKAEKKSQKPQKKNAESNNATSTQEAEKPSFRTQVDKRNPKAANNKTVKKGKDGKPKKNIFKRMFAGIKSIVSELKKVTWPKGKQVGQNLLIVLVFVVLFLLVLVLIDYVLSGLLSLLLGNGWVTLFS